MKRWFTIPVHLFTNKRYGNDWKADPGQSLGFSSMRSLHPENQRFFRAVSAPKKKALPTTTCENQTRISMINAATVQRHQAIPALL